MSGDWQQYVVWLILIWAAAAVIRALGRHLRPGGGCGGCSGCGQSAPERPLVSIEKPKASHPAARYVLGSDPVDSEENLFADTAHIHRQAAANRGD